MEGVCRERRPQTGGGADLPARGVAGSGRALILSADTTLLYVQPPALIPTASLPSSRSALPQARGHWRAASILGLASKLYYLIYYRVPIKRRDYTLAPADRPPARARPWSVSVGSDAPRADHEIFYIPPVESKRIHRRVRWNGTIPQYRAISLLRLRASGRSRHARKRPVRSRHESRATTRRMAVAPRTRARVPAPPNDVIILMITLIMVNAHSVLVQQSRGSQSAVDSTP